MKNTNIKLIERLFKTLYSIFINADFSELSEKEMLEIYLKVGKQYADNCNLDFGRIAKNL